MFQLIQKRYESVMTRWGECHNLVYYPGRNGANIISTAFEGDTLFRFSMDLHNVVMYFKMGIVVFTLLKNCFYLLFPI